MRSTTVVRFRSTDKSGDGATSNVSALVVAVAKSKLGALTFSSGGSGTSHHLSGVLFGRATGTDLVHVPYKNAPQAVLAVMSNEVTMGFFNIPLVIAQGARGDERHALATVAKRAYAR
jgi:tripartite-type tricarboxylate transporter receptor subunit TctC